MPWRDAWRRWHVAEYRVKGESRVVKKMYRKRSGCSAHWTRRMVRSTSQTPCRPLECLADRFQRDDYRSGLWARSREGSNILQAALRCLSDGPYMNDFVTQISSDTRDEEVINASNPKANIRQFSRKNPLRYIISQASIDRSDWPDLQWPKH